VGLIVCLRFPNVSPLSFTLPSSVPQFGRTSGAGASLGPRSPLRNSGQPHLLHAALG